MAVFRGPRDEDDDDRESGRRPGTVRPGAGSSGPEAPPATFWWFAVQYLRRNHGKVAGVVLGLWAGFGIMELGVLWTLFISLCVGLGYFIGKRLDENQENLWEFLDRILPPGRN